MPRRELSQTPLGRSATGQPLLFAYRLHPVTALAAASAIWLCAGMLRAAGPEPPWAIPFELLVASVLLSVHWAIPSLLITGAALLLFARKPA
jgi:hypothetical protein